MEAAREEFAPAKVNLTLRIVGKREDGYHELESLVVFADFGDILTLEPGSALSLDVRGPMAAEMGDPDDNLVRKAAQALMERVEDLRTGRFVLRKRLPPAAGLGGGSSDAAAALRALAGTNGLPLDDARVVEAAVATGADVPVCLDPCARVMRGIGERLSEPLDLPPISAVLANPGVKLETRHVFDAFARGPRTASDGNDLEEAATSLVPEIADVLAALGAYQDCGMARMSGSGATCFGIFPDRRAAAQAARAIREDHPDWWVRATTLNPR